jgi:hypothetical protein
MMALQATTGYTGIIKIMSSKEYLQIPFKPIEF